MRQLAIVIQNVNEDFCGFPKTRRVKRPRNSEAYAPATSPTAEFRINDWTPRKVTAWPQLSREIFLFLPTSTREPSAGTSQTLGSRQKSQRRGAGSRGGG